MANIKEKRKRFNFIDVILLIVIVTLIGVLGYIGFKAYDNYFHKEASGTPIKYEILIEGVSNEIKYSINEGDSITEADSLTAVGKVVGYTVTPSKFIGTDANGETVISDHPDKSDIIITVEVKATGFGGTYDINGYSITVGRELNFRMCGFSATGKCISVEAL